MRLFIVTSLITLSAFFGFSLSEHLHSLLTSQMVEQRDKKIKTLSIRLENCRTENILLREKASFSHLSSSIISCESSGNPLAYNSTSKDHGLFQINEYWHSEKMENMGLSIKNPIDNYIYGLYLLRIQGTEPWKASRGCWSKLTKMGE